MKKVKLLLASALIIGAVAVQAQDTARVAGAQDRTGAVNQDKTQPGQANYQKDMTVIQSADVPSSLRSTLQGDQYKGWESNSTIYRSKNNDQYVVEMHDGTKTKAYYFGKDGKAMKGY